MLRYNLVKKIKFLFFFSLVFSASINAKVITSIKPIGFITSAIADGVVDTEILVSDGMSPHSYALKPSDLMKIRSADMIIWIGDDMETFLTNILSKQKQKQVKLIDYPQIQALLQKGHSHEDEDEDHHHHHHHNDSDHAEHHEEFDMHIWLSPEIAENIAVIIHDELVNLYPEKSALLDSNLEIFIAKRKEVEQIIAKKLNSVQNNGYFVFHDAYGYFEKKFKLNNLGSFTINPSVQPGLKKIHEIQNELASKNAVCIFKEPQFSPAIMNKIIDNTTVKVGELDPLGMKIELSPTAYFDFLLTMTQQFLNCLE